jgi:hypothetical protein
MASLKELARCQAITVIQALVDEETWQCEFRELFEDIELFYAFDTRIEPGMVTVTLYTHNPENLERLLEHSFEIKENDLQCVPTVEDAEALTLTTIKSLLRRP